MWKMNCWIKGDVTGPWFTHNAMTTMANTNASTLVTITWLAVNANAKTFPQKSKSWRLIDYHTSKPDCQKKWEKSGETIYRGLTI